MHSALTIVLLLSTACLARYNNYEARNLVEEDERAAEPGVLVECPVCKPISNGPPTREVCDVIKGNKMYKRCLRGTYINERCGNRLDCYRGPKEQCTEKMDENWYDQKCAYGYYCDDTYHKCTGLGFTPNSRERFYLQRIHSGF